ncbi:aldo/keto reductase [Mucilaginibacter terrenus]|uniref:Aldo/keto reductase n=1 Tax=Mucilaginibacter terrenus TaxID=2482727 RepID=A0A3E2NXN3_9SPHI|nr:aldo/keto reductase [Mucilaginibacter terrenus]RFZ85778.1 aldo/keto reductase [Mucilaginibacter terrenus]
MRKVELCNGIISSKLGFGCASILGAIDSSTARRAVHGALAHEINYFDLARSYGYGEAESFLGNILKDRRKDVVIASKFGIKANWKAKLLKPIKPVVRLLKSKTADKKIVADKGAPVSTIADRFHNRVEITAKEMVDSLEQSLRNLKTDYLDYFFVHEPVCAIYDIDEVLRAAEALKQSGKIRAFGLAFNLLDKQIHERYLHHFDLLQFNKPLDDTAYQSTLSERQNKPNVLFSILRGLKNDEITQDVFGRLMEDFPQSVLLCSMFNEKHIEQNATFFNI